MIRAGFDICFFLVWEGFFVLAIFTDPIYLICVTRTQKEAHVMKDAAQTKICLVMKHAIYKNSQIFAAAPIHHVVHSN